MRCPKDNTKLKEFFFNGVNLDKCPKCSGMWFDPGELSKIMDERDGDLSWVHFELWAENKGFSNRKSERLCPRDEVYLVTARYLGVEIDICPKCHGIWLDKGEMTKIIDHLERSIDEKSVPSYIREIVKESGRAFFDPKHGIVEAHHVLILFKLMQYRVLAEHQSITGIISTLPT